VRAADQSANSIVIALETIGVANLVSLAPSLSEVGCLEIDRMRRRSGSN
jgi:hypothetical protein